METIEYIQCKLVTPVPNLKQKSAANKVYIQLTTDDGVDYLFTESQLRIAKNRAVKNPEDLYDFSEIAFNDEDVVKLEDDEDWNPIPDESAYEDCGCIATPKTPWWMFWS